MIKKSIINELGDEIFLQALQIFLRNAEKDFTLFNLYIENQDYSNAKLLSHKLIGSCEAIRVKKLPELLREADNNLKQRYVRKENLIEINMMYDKLKEYINSVYEMQIED